jgi:Ion channel
MPSLNQQIITLLMVIATAMVQVAAQLTLDRIIGSMPRARAGQFAGFHKMAFTITAVLVLMCGHIGQVTIWALRYYEWGELRGFVNSFYFSLASFTTVGASELELSRDHRLTGAIESALGMLMFGWSTALLFEIIQRADREHRI